ncbi:hypothetical protein KAI87_03955, partial [Myxococcota bacterium]|nr:hypothetical protein [Myxococcota bacterium]
MKNLNINIPIFTGLILSAFLLSSCDEMIDENDSYPPDTPVETPVTDATTTPQIEPAPVEPTAPVLPTEEPPVAS